MTSFKETVLESEDYEELSHLFPVRTEDRTVKKKKKAAALRLVNGNSYSQPEEKVLVTLTQEAKYS